MTRGVDALVDRMAALRRFVAAADGYLPAPMLAPARALLDRAGERLALSREHTVVALAGATGSGKSSIFNAIAGAPLSTVGVRRPTTGQAAACVWGGDATGLLDWLAVGPRYHHDPGELPGLVLLDLPDFDSVESAHRVEVDRLVGLADLLVWVLDPQKYADRVLHKQYLERFHRHREITVVALNQADRLAPADRRRCLEDLRRLVTEDGLDGAPVLAASATDEPGLAELTGTLRRAVAARQAALRRLAADLDGVRAELAPAVGAEPPGVDGPGDRVLVEALANAAGVPLVVRATERSYVHRGVKATGWPPSRWLRRFRPDPLRRLHLGDPGLGGATSVPTAAPAARAAVGLGLRALAERGGAGLPEPWPAAVLAAARSREPDLADALDLAIRRTDVGVARRPLWWRAVGVVQWLATLAAVVGLGWLALRWALSALGVAFVLADPHVGRVPVPTLLLGGGLLGGILVSLLVRPVLAVAARRAGARARARMLGAVRSVAADLVLAPVAAVLRAYREARAAHRAAGA